MDELITPTQIAQISTSLSQLRQIDAISAISIQLATQDYTRKMEDAFLKDCRDRLFDIYEWLQTEAKASANKSPASAYIRLCLVESESHHLLDHKLYPDFQSKEFTAKLRTTFSETKSDLRNQIARESLIHLDRHVADHIQAKIERLNSERLKKQNAEHQILIHQQTTATEAQQLTSRIYIILGLIVFVAFLVVLIRAAL